MYHMYVRCSSYYRRCIYEFMNTTTVFLHLLSWLSRIWILVKLKMYIFCIIISVRSKTWKVWTQIGLYRPYDMGTVRVSVVIIPQKCSSSCHKTGCTKIYRLFEQYWSGSGLQLHCNLPLAFYWTFFIAMQLDCRFHLNLYGRVLTFTKDIKQVTM